MTPEPGWYPDPDHRDSARWWDGKVWTGKTAPLSTLGANAPAAIVVPHASPRRRPLMIALVAAAILAVGFAAFATTAWLKNRDADPAAVASPTPTTSSTAAPEVGSTPNPSASASPVATGPVVATSESGLVSLTVDSGWEDASAIVTGGGERLETVDGITTELVGAWITSGIRVTDQDTLVVYATYGDDAAADPAADHQTFVTLLSEGLTVPTPPTATAFTTTAGDAGWKTTIVGSDELGPIVIHAATVNRGGMFVTVQYTTPGEQPTDPVLLDALLAGLILVALPAPS